MEGDKAVATHGIEDGVLWRGGRGGVGGAVHPGVAVAGGDFVGAAVGVVDYEVQHVDAVASGGIVDDEDGCGG